MANILSGYVKFAEKHGQGKSYGIKLPNLKTKKGKVPFKKRIKKLNQFLEFPSEDKPRKRK